MPMAYFFEVRAFFFAVEVPFTFRVDFLETVRVVDLGSLESDALILAALFLWIMFPFTARSIAEYASLIFEGDFRAMRIARSRAARLASFSFSRFLSFLNFLIADFITGTLPA